MLSFLMFLNIFLVLIINAQDISANDNLSDGLLDDPAVEKVIRTNLDRLYEKGTKKGKASSTIFQQLGFESANETRTVKVERGFPIYIIELDELKRYENGVDPWSLLSAITQTTIYPLSVPKHNGFTARSAVTVTYRSEKEASPTARVVEIGNPILIRLLTEARLEQQNHGRCNPPTDCFVVSIPALGRYLFGYRSSITKAFNAIDLNEVRGHVKEGDLKPAQEVVERLSDDAKTGKYDRPAPTTNSKRRLDPNLLPTGEKSNATTN